MTYDPLSHLQPLQQPHNHRITTLTNVLQSFHEIQVSGALVGDFCSSPLSIEVLPALWSLTYLLAMLLVELSSIGHSSLETYLRCSLYKEAAYIIWLKEFLAEDFWNASEGLEGRRTEVGRKQY